MALRALLMAGTVLPLTLASVSEAGVFATPKPVASPLFVLIQDEVPAERLAARERFTAAKERLREARASLTEAEQTGGDLQAARALIEEADDEVRKARQALVQFILADVPRNRVEEVALKEERAARDEAGLAAAPVLPDEAADASAEASPPPEEGEVTQAPEVREPPAEEQVGTEQADTDLGLTREERRRRREERRAAAEAVEDLTGDTVPPDTDSVAEAPAEVEEPDAGEPAAAAEDATGAAVASEADVGADAPGQAELPEASDSTAEAEEQQAEAELGLTREERRRRREERRAAAEAADDATADTLSPEADAVATAPLEEVSAEELQQRRRERREARRRRAPDQDQADVLNQILQNQITINQNQTTIDQTTIDQSTTTNQVIVNQQTVEQQQVIEQQTGPSAQGEQAGDRAGLLDRARRRGERLARLEAQARERELRGELRATQRELEHTREELRDSRLRLGDEIIRRDADRIIVRRGDQILVLRADNEDRFGYVEDVERFPNGYVRSVAVRGEIRIVTLYDPEGAIVRRSRVLPSGEEMVLIDAEPAVGVRERRGRDLPPVVIEAPRREIVIESRRASSEDIEAALAAPPLVEPPRTFTLEEVRHSEQVRDLVPRVDLDTITFEFDSAVVPEDQLITLEKVGIALEDILFEAPNEVFLIEGHTDAPGTDVYNLALSDRRAEAVAMALSENFDVPPENLVTQGYGEEHLKIPTAERERANRRVSIRRITALVNTAEAP